MSEKRFTEDESYLVNYEEYKCIFDRVQGKHLYLSEVIDLLNSLNDENEQLKKEKYELIKRVTNGIRISYSGYIQLEKENEQLRQQLKKYEDREFDRTQARGW